MSRPVLPVKPADLEEMVARLWPPAAREHGVDPERVGAGIRADGWLTVTTRLAPRAEEDAGIESLACALEDAGLEVERHHLERRVLGWAAIEALPAPQLVRLIDLEAESPWCTRVRRWRDGLITERAARTT